MEIAVLALQGSFIEHRQKLKKLGVDTFEIRQLKDIDRHFDGLILPGGESTTQGKLLRELGLFEPLKEKILNGLPVFGTCAGLILLAENLENDNKVKCHFGTMPATVARNAYGRQLGSFSTKGTFGETKNVEMTFIRAPYVPMWSPDVQVLAKINERVVAVRYKNQLGIAFHPELTNDKVVYEYFLDMIEYDKNNRL